MNSGFNDPTAKGLIISGYGIKWNINFSKEVKVVYNIAV